VDNRPIAQVFAEIADLLEIKDANAFKIRAYRTAAETIAAWPDPITRLDEKQLRDLPGVGRDLAAKIRELADTGACAYHQELLQEFPPTILDLLRLQGVGPKTVAMLYSALNIQSVEALAAAAREGRLRGLKGMGPKKEALILKAIEEREKDGDAISSPRPRPRRTTSSPTSASVLRRWSSFRSAACGAAARRAGTSTSSRSAAMRP
jgi:DNA polymerase (family 10)